MYPHNNPSFREIEEQFAKDQGLPFQDALPEEEIRAVMQEQNIEYRKRTLTPIITLWAFLSQVLGQYSCKTAADNIVAFFASIGEFILLSDGAYCKGRKRLKEGFLSSLTHKVSNGLQEDLTEEQLWKGRRVKTIDGSSFIMPDTPENQEVYPQWRQKEGCGFPIARFAVMFCLCTGMVLEFYIAPMSVSERTSVSKNISTYS